MSAVAIAVASTEVIIAMAANEVLVAAMSMEVMSTSVKESHRAPVRSMVIQAAIIYEGSLTDTAYLLLLR